MIPLPLVGNNLDFESIIWIISTQHHVHLLANSRSDPPSWISLELIAKLPIVASIRSPSTRVAGSLGARPLQNRLLGARPLWNRSLAAKLHQDQFDQDPADQST
jgi:hypothetical protein